MSFEPIFKVKFPVSLNAASDQPRVIWPDKILSQERCGAPQPLGSDVLAKSLGVIFCEDDRLSQSEVLCVVTARARRGSIGAQQPIPRLGILEFAINAGRG